MKYLFLLLFIVNTTWCMKQKTKIPSLYHLMVHQVAHNLGKIPPSQIKKINRDVAISIINQTESRKLIPPIDVTLTDKEFVSIDSNGTLATQARFAARNRTLTVGGQFIHANLRPLYLYVYENPQKGSGNQFGKELFAIGKNDPSPITHITIAPSKQRAALVRKNNSLYVYDISSQSETPLSILQLSAPINKIAFDASGGFILLCNESNKLMLYDFFYHNKYLVSNIAFNYEVPKNTSNKLICNTTGVELPKKVYEALPIKYRANELTTLELRTLLNYLQFRKSQTQNTRSKKALVTQLQKSTLEKPVKDSFIATLR